MTSLQITVVARIKAQAGQETAVRDILSKLPEPTRREAGCLNYDLHQSLNDPTVFLFHENWRSQEDLDRHLKTPHVTGALAQVGPLMAEPPQITVWKRIA